MSTCCAPRPARRSHHQRLAVVAADAPDVPTADAPDVRAADAPGVRAGDIERERTATRLGQAFTQGYLTMEEYETRLSRAFAATNVAALTHLTADLPVRQISRRDPRRRAARSQAARRGVQIHLLSYLAMAVAVTSIWLAIALTAGAWYFWPVWPILGGGIGIVSHAIGVALGTRSIPKAGVGIPGPIMNAHTQTALVTGSSSV